MQDFFQIIANFGFPIAVASYLLFRFEKKLEILENTNDDLVTEIKGLREKILELNGLIKKLKK